MTDIWTLPQAHDLTALERVLGEMVRDMRACPQDPIHHAEGNVWTHTKMVLDHVLCDPAWTGLKEDDKFVLYWASVLHDCGKPGKTKHEDGRITSRGHSRLGSHIARAWLFERDVPFSLRERICALILAHQAPFWLFERDRRAGVEILATTDVELLFYHARADALGRVCADTQDLLDRIALSAVMMAESRDAFDTYLTTPYAVTSYLRHDHWIGHVPVQPTGSRVTLMGGMAGAGKDTWLATHAPDLPVVSLDAWRRTLNLKRGRDGQAIQAAKEQAREYLRSGTDFAWNATNLTARTRGQVLDMIDDYNGQAHGIWIEPPLKTLLAQNKNRTHAIPTSAVLSMVSTFEPFGPKDMAEITFVF